MFNSKNFSVMSYANGFTLWNYTTEDSLETIKSENYFDETAPFARKGDMILAVAGKESTVEAAVLFVKTVADGSVVTADIIPASAAPVAPDSGQDA